jgi:mannose-1-phosphate guanylyltransferase
VEPQTIPGRQWLETTLQRVGYYTPVDYTLVVINSNHVAIAGDRLRHLPAANVLTQPCNRNTGPGLLFALMALADRDPAALVSVFPSDHYVRDERAFVAYVKQEAGVVRQCPDKNRRTDPTRSRGNPERN